MANSAGSAEAELATYQESAEYLFNQFKETFTSIAQNAIKRDDLKNLINAGTTILGIVDNIVSQVGLLPAILSTAVGIIAAKKNVSNNLLGFNVNNGKFGMNFLGAQVGSGWKQQRAEIKAQSAEYKTALNDLYAGMVNGEQESTKFQAAFTKAMSSNNAEVQSFAQKAKQGTATIQDMTTATTALGGAGAKLKGVLAGLGNAVLSIGISIGISALINGIYSAINNAVHSYENHISKLKELDGEIKNLKSEIETVNSQLSTTKERIWELEQLPTLTLLEESELRVLQQTNDELERQLNIKKAQIEADKVTANKEGKALLREMTGTEYWKWWDYLVPANWFGNLDETLDYQMLCFEQYKQVIEELGNKTAPEFADRTEEEWKKIEEFTAVLKSQIMGFYGDWQTLLSKLDADDPDEMVQKYLPVLQDLVNQWNTQLKGFDDEFYNLYNDSYFAAVKSRLEELANAGELNSKKFEKLTDKDIKGIEEFKEALNDIEGATFEKVVESIIESAEKAKEKLDNATDSVISFSEALEKLEVIVSKQETLADVFKKIQLNGSISPKEAKDLLKEIPDILEYLERTADGYTISVENIKEANNELAKSEMDVLGKKITDAKTDIYELEKLKELAIALNNSDGRDTELIDKYNAQLEKTEELREKLGVKSAGEIDLGIDKLEEGIKESSFQLNLLEQAFDGLVIADIFNDAKSAVSDYNKDIQALDNAIKNLGEGAHLSYDEMVNLVDIEPELERQHLIEDLGNGKYSVEINKLEELRKKRYEVRNEYIDGLIKQGEAELDAANNTKDVYERILNFQKQFGSETEQLAAQIELDAANMAIKQIEDAISKFEAMKGDLTVGDDKGDDFNSLQNQINYYKNIISAIEIMRDKYSEAFEKEKEALENEKKALQEGKDALKENNDERQRELDLIEARNNLENAKKRKVWVYSEGSGFKQVQDKGAVKEAEEKYRDIITDIQEAEIDKKIKELDKNIEENEKQQEAFEKSLEDMTKLEQNIEDAKTVEQAKTALGLADEKDLLNLSDAVKYGIKNGLAEAIIEKDNEENKDNTYYKPADLNDVLKSLGASVTSEDLKAMKSELPTEAVYNAAVKGFADSLKEFSKEAVQNITNNNNGMVVSPTFNIYDASDPNKVAEVVNLEITNLLTRYNNSIK